MKFNQIKNNLFSFKFLYICLAFAFIINLFYSFYKINNVTLVPSCLFKTPLEDESTANVGTFITDNTSNNSEIINYFNELFKTRNQSFLNGNVTELYKFYDISQTYSKNSLMHEFKRIAYLRDWGSERNIDFSTIKSYPEINDITVKGNTYTVTLTEEYKFEYYYKDTPTINNDFGISLYHTIDLQKIGNSYLVIRDHYLDCFQNGLDDYSFNLTEKYIPLTKVKTYNINFTKEILNLPKNKNYDREAAVNYANEYCCISWVNNNRDNTKYRKYISACGNCTNFISQCLSDFNQGGKLSQDKYWKYSYNKHDIPIVSEAWVSPKELINYLILNKRALTSVRGNFNNLYNSGYFESSEFASIQKGDLISYKINNEIEHNTIITGFDSKGYPLINANSINKYKVPFDFGWSNDNISFDIISIID